MSFFDPYADRCHIKKSVSLKESIVLTAVILCNHMECQRHACYDYKLFSILALSKLGLPQYLQGNVHIMKFIY